MELAKIQERKDGKWEVTFLGEVLMFTKNLVWVKSNLRKSRKAQNLGLRKFEVVVDGKVSEIFDLDGKNTKTKTPRKAKEKTVVAPVENDGVRKQVTVNGVEGTQLEGHTRTGFLKNKEGRVITVQFFSKRDGGISVDYEFDAKTGRQNTENPNHIWEIEKNLNGQFVFEQSA